MLPSFLEQSDNLFAFNARKPLKKLFDRVTRFQMIKETLHGHARPYKNGLAAENIRILRYHLAHTFRL